MYPGLLPKIKFNYEVAARINRKNKELCFSKDRDQDNLRKWSSGTKRTKSHGSSFQEELIPVAFSILISLLNIQIPVKSIFIGFSHFPCHSLGLFRMGDLD